MTPEEELRGIDARITALSACAFVKDGDLKGASAALQLYYDDHAADAGGLVGSANALIGALLGVARDVTPNSDVFRDLVVGLVGSGG